MHFQKVELILGQPLVGLRAGELPAQLSGELLFRKNSTGATTLPSLITGRKVEDLAANEILVPYP